MEGIIQETIIQPNVKHIYQGKAEYVLDKGWACRLYDRMGIEIGVVGYYPTQDECRGATLKRVIAIIKELEKVG